MILAHKVDNDSYHVVSLWPTSRTRPHLTLKLTTPMSHLGWRLVPAAILVMLGFLLFPSAGHDDTHITCWPAYTLSRFGQILNYNGERIEQSSSLLQVLLLAAFGKLTSVDMLTLAKLSSIVFGAATVLLLFTLVTRVATPAAGFCAAMIAATSTPIVYWSFSGMETTLVSFTGLCLILTAADYIGGHQRGSLWKPSLALSSFALVRPETPLLIACFLTSALAVVTIKGQSATPHEIGRKTIVQRVLLLVLIGALVCGTLFVFRLAYFGALFPQTVTAKFSGTSVQNIVTGLHYVKQHAWNDGPATAIVSSLIALSVVLAATGQLRTGTLNLHVVLSLLFAVGYLCSVVGSGGDWMEGGRFLVHFLPVAIGCVPLALKGLTRRTLVLPLVSAIVVGLQATTTIAFARDSSTSLPLWAHMAAAVDHAEAQYSWFERHSRINLRDMPLIENLDDVVRQTSDVKPGPVVVMSGQMGMATYHIALRHFGHVRFMDRHGLADRALTDCPIARNVGRDTGGLILSFDWYFENLTDLDRSCGLVRPDILFDIRSNDVEGYGYPTVYSQSGDVAALGTRLTGLTVRADAFVAVEASLVETFEKQSPRHFRFGQ